MDELAVAAAGNLKGELAEKRLNEFRRKMAEWRAALPAVEVLISDFGLGDFDRTGLIEAWIANEMAAGYCAKYLFVFAGQSCPEHRHRVKTETFFVVHGEVTMVLDGIARTMRPGDTLPVRPGMAHSFTGLNGPALLLEASTPCVVADNYFTDTAIPVGGNHRGRP